MYDHAFRNDVQVPFTKVLGIPVLIYMGRQRAVTMAKKKKILVFPVACQIKIG